MSEQDAAALATARQSLRTAQEALENTTEEAAGPQLWKQLNDSVTHAQQVINNLTGKRSEPTSGGRKRKLPWLLSDYKPEDDDDDVYNQSNSDASLKDRVEPEPVLDYDFIVKLNEMLDEGPGYDAEANALGRLPKNLYMLIPTSCKATICPLEYVGAASDKYQVGITDMAGVYALAKEQAKHISSNPTDHIKWAVIRLEAFKAGWYDDQKHCRRVEAPKDSVQTMNADMDLITKYANQAWDLCLFIPYLIEFNFRTKCSCPTFTSETLTAYTQKAKMLAKSSKVAASLDYLKPEVLFGDAFRWVGVKRPMNVLKSDNPYIPNVFLVRKLWAPSGQAMITSANEIINSMKGVKWWDPIKAIGGYQDDVIETLANKIGEDPWKYHQLASSYGLGGLTQAEMDSINTAKEQVIKMAPVLQAFMETVLRTQPWER